MAGEMIRRKTDQTLEIHKCVCIHQETTETRESRITKASPSSQATLSLSFTVDLVHYKGLFQCFPPLIVSALHHAHQKFQPHLLTWFSIPDSNGSHDGQSVNVFFHHLSIQFLFISFTRIFIKSKNASYKFTSLTVGRLLSLSEHTSI